MIFEDIVMRHKLVGGKQEASICRCYMVQSRKCMYLCICSSIFDTVEDCSRTGCGLETDRVWLSLSVCACVCSSFFLSLSEAEWKGTQIKAVYFLLREEKGEWAALLCPPLRSLPPECQAHEWLRGGGGRRKKREDGWHSYVLCEPLCFCPMSEIVALAWGLFRFSCAAADARLSTDVKTIGPQQCLCFRAQKGL